MYFPKSQIKTNLYSRGELQLLSNSQQYTGFYWINSKGEAFTGKNPDSEVRPRRLTLPTFDLYAQDKNPQEGPSTIYNVTPDTLSYFDLKKINYNESAPRPPRYIPPKITEEDYKTGEITRYFCKKNRESYFIEVDEKDFELVKSKSKEVQSNMYITFTLPWVITGLEEKVALENQKSVQYKESHQNAQGLGQYLKHNYLQFYSSTPGVKTINSSKVYQYTGEPIPKTLPDSYQLGNIGNHKNQACASCFFFQNEACNQWNASVKGEYWCKAYKKNSSIDSQSETPSLSPSTPSSNIYTQRNNQGGTIGY